jgi:hypothetical protein
MRDTTTAFFIITFSLIGSMSKAQPTAPDAYDFWIGTWNAEWTNPDGTKGQATNRITRIMGRVLHEHFVDTTSRFEGMSMSVLDPKDSLWHQAWADNQGSYFNFIGERADGMPAFRTLPKKRGDKVIVQRMLFKDIAPNAFTWDWQLSEDGGRTWSLKWRIQYTRARE